MLWLQTLSAIADYGIFHCLDSAPPRNVLCCFSSHQRATSLGPSTAFPCLGALFTFDVDDIAVVVLVGGGGIGVGVVVIVVVVVVVVVIVVAFFVCGCRCC